MRSRLQESHSCAKRRRVRSAGRLIAPPILGFAHRDRDMGILDWLLGRRRQARRPVEYSPPRFGLCDLARRLGLSEAELRAVRPSYREFDVPKRSGGTRRLAAPDPALKALQKRILRRALGRLRAHPAATGFERGHSIVTHALFHADKAVVVRIDIQDFFASTAACRVEDYLRSMIETQRAQSPGGTG